MRKPIRILLQTTIPATEDDWHVGRFSLLCEYLGGLRDDEGSLLCEVTARDREVNKEGDDPVLSRLGATDFDELWLFAVDAGDGLTEADCRGITRFRQRGGGILSTRDHQDLGSSLCTLGGVGRAHFFHSRQQDPDETMRARRRGDENDLLAELSFGQQRRLSTSPARPPVARIPAQPCASSRSSNVASLWSIMPSLLLRSRHRRLIMSDLIAEQLRRTFP